MIPVLAYLFIPTRIALSGDTQCFLERAAKIQFGIMICLYCLSHAAGAADADDSRVQQDTMRGCWLYLVLVVQMMAT